MKVAILEYICGSGIFRDHSPDGNQPPLNSLLSEGYAMLAALTNDMIDAGVNVYSPIEPSIAAWPRWRTWHDSRWTWSPIPFDDQRSVDDVATHWIESIQGCDAAIVIAPELDGILQQITARLRHEGISVLASDATYLTTACDQWETCQAWRTAGVRHPDTYLLGEFLRIDPPPSEDRCWVIKRRDSAGCVGLQRFANSRILALEATQQAALRNAPDRWIVQPWIPGIAASLAVLSGEQNRALGAFEQHFEKVNQEDQTDWGYSGGAGPIAGVNPQALERFASEVLTAIPGRPQGWIGIDFIIEPDGRWCAIEVNSRLTTSYLGYRKWYGNQLAGSWARGNSPPIEIEEFPRVCFSVKEFEG